MNNNTIPIHDTGGWKYLLPAKKTERILCVETTNLILSTALANTCVELVVLHHDQEILHYLEADHQAQGIRNTRYVLYTNEAQRMPFTENYFDGVIVAELGKVADLDLSTNVYRTKHYTDSFIRELYRILRGNGYLYLTVKNKYGYDNIKKLLMPRSKQQQDESFLSAKSIKQAIRKAGFGATKCYKLITENGKTKEIILSTTYRSTQNGITLKERVKSFVLNSPLGESLAPSIAMICMKDTPEQRYIDLLVKQVRNTLSASIQGQKGMEAMRYIILPGKVVISIGKNNEIHGDRVAILPLNEIVSERLKHEAQTLRELHGIKLSISALIPRYYGEVMIGGQVNYIQQELPGTTIDAPVRTLDEITERALAALITLHQETSLTITIDDAHYQRLFGEPMNRIEVKLGELAIPTLNRLRKVVRKAVMGKVLRTVWMHGDYKIENLMIDRKSQAVNGIIDWDLSIKYGLPYLDLLYLILYNRVIRERREIDDIFVEYAFQKQRSAHEQSLVSKYQQQLLINSHELDLLEAMFWIYHVAYRIEVISNDVQSIRRKTTVLNYIEKHVARKYSQSRSDDIT